MAPGPCCDSHGRNCEPPADLCCQQCTEVAHDTFPIRHADGSVCSAPDPSGTSPGPVTPATGAEQRARDHIKVALFNQGVPIDVIRRLLTYFDTLTAAVDERVRAQERNRIADAIEALPVIHLWRPILGTAPGSTNDVIDRDAAVGAARGDTLAERGNQT